MQLLINNLTYENINLVTTLNVNFVRDNKNYTKPIYLILTEYMKDNLKNENVYQFFTDVTYYATPTSSKKFKIFSILGFDSKEVKTL